MDHNLDELNRAYRSGLMSYFQRRLKNHALAEDMTQELFARLARTDAHPDNPAAYIFRMAANMLKDRVRQERLRDGYNRELQTQDYLGVDPLAPERTVLAREQLVRVLATLRELEPRTMQIFLLYRLEKMKRADIAATFGMSVSSVEKYIAKAGRHVTLALNLETEADR